MSGVALVTTLNRVNPLRYDGWGDKPGKGLLSGCHADGDAISAILADAGFRVERLRDDQATGAAVTGRLATLAAEMQPGSLLVWHYSGHGTQVPDASGDERDGLDEALVLFDGLLLDDAVARAWTLFRPDVDVVFLCDACSSGSMGRAQAAGVNPIIWGRERSTPQARVLTISGCRDDQKSGETEAGGLFTQGMIRTLGAANKPLTWRQLWRQTRRKLPRWQQPVLDELGPKGLADRPAFQP